MKEFNYKIRFVRLLLTVIAFASLISCTGQPKHENAVAIYASADRPFSEPVSHDQNEAFAMADRLAIMNHGRLVQVGTPVGIRQSPSDPFVRESLIGVCQISS